MSQREPVRIVDLWDIRLRVGTVRFGVWTTVPLCSLGIAYCLASFDSPNRPLMIVLLAAATAVSLLIALLDAERIVRSRWRELFFLAWSLVDIGFIATLVTLDGGVTSPFACVFFLPLIFAALSYPLLLVWPICLLDVGAALMVGAAVGNPDWVHLGFFAGVLACSGFLCVGHARENEKLRRDLAQVSRTDSLTDSLNRRGFEERLDAELGESTRAGRPLTLVLIDLDDFKRVNDTLGHAAGDELLCWVVSTVRGALRPIDAIGRLGGDEFAVMLPGAARPEALEVCARIREALSERIAATMGLATFPIDAADREELHQRADAELYSAKHGSKLRLGGQARDLGWAAGLAHTVDRRSTPADDHSSSVARYATGIARRLRWDGDALSLLGIAGMLHDVGKITLPERILRGPDVLTPDERDRELRDHAIVGAELVTRVEGLEPAATWIRHCHEHWDGSGYPDGLRGEAIPLGARILHVADAFASMTGRRAYRDSLSPDAALEELHGQAGLQFDPVCVEALEAHLSGSAEAA
jgi:diguanylate cyclase (GGDEF)-like protein